MREQFKVHWHTGMLLLAQHFQQSDRYAHYRLQSIINAINPYSYGVLQLDLDTAVENQIVVKSIHAIMPNLEMVYFKPVSAEDNLYINISNVIADLADGIYYVYLCMPDADVTHEFSHIPVVQNIADNINNDLMEAVTVLKPKLQLILSKDAPLQMQSLPLLELDIVNKQYTITQFEATFLKWQENSMLYRRLESLVMQIRNKITYWQKNPEHNSHADMVKMGFMSQLVVLEEQLSAKAHSYEIFRTVLGIIGSVSFLYNGILPRFTYNHDNVVKSFEECFAYMSKLLMSMHDQYERIQFKIHENAFRLKLSADIKTYTDKDSQERFLIVGAKKFQKNNLNMLKDWANSCVVGTTEHIAGIKRSRVLGARRELVDIMESLHIQSSGDYLFFLIYIDENMINMKDDELIIYNENMQAFPDLLELYTDSKDFK